jgi:hypothetical protein
MSKRKHLEKVVSLSSENKFNEQSLFEDIGKEYEKMEKDFEKEKGLAVALRTVKIILKMMWGAFRWMVQTIKSMINWIQQRRRPADQSPYFLAE